MERGGCGGTTCDGARARTLLAGPSGAGKSLLLRTLACLDEAQVRPRAQCGLQGGLPSPARRARPEARAADASPAHLAALHDAGRLPVSGRRVAAGARPARCRLPAAAARRRRRARPRTPLPLGSAAVWRASVCYVSQSRWAFPGTPLETFTAFRRAPRRQPPRLRRGMPQYHAWSSMPRGGPAAPSPRSAGASTATCARTRRLWAWTKAQ